MSADLVEETLAGERDVDHFLTYLRQTLGDGDELSRFLERSTGWSDHRRRAVCRRLQRALEQRSWG